MSDEHLDLARRILSTSPDWLLHHLKDVGVEGDVIEVVSESLIALSLDLANDHPTREQAVRAACRLAAVNQLRMCDHQRFLDQFGED